MMEYKRLNKENCNEIVEFLDRVFTDHNGVQMNFKAETPQVFRESDETMGWHIASFENGKMCGCAGNYPVKYKIGETVLQIGAIENVAVDSSCRGKGIMQSMLNKLFEEEDKKGYDMYHLLGDRWRYRNFGFERCGSIFGFRFTRSMLGKEPAEESFEIIRVHEGDEAVADLYKFYMNQYIHQEFDIDTFFYAFKKPEHENYMVKNKAGECIAYISAVNGSAFSDIVLADVKYAKDVFKNYFDYRKVKVIDIALTSFSALFDFAIKNAERYSMSQNGCFRIVNFKKVTETFMKIKSRNEYMPDGEITINSEIFGKWCIKKDGEEISVNPFDGDADYILPGFTVYSFLFDILPPKAHCEKDVLLKSWFPLPIYSPAFR